MEPVTNPKIILKNTLQKYLKNVERYNKLFFVAFHDEDKSNYTTYVKIHQAV